MHDRDIAISPAVCQVIAADSALKIVATDDSEDVAVAFFGKPRVCRTRLDHQDAGAPVDLGCGNRSARAGGAEGDGDCLTDELLRRQRRQLGIAAVIDEISSSGSPKTPPLALRSAIASSVPARCGSPSQA